LFIYKKVTQDTRPYPVSLLSLFGVLEARRSITVLTVLKNITRLDPWTV